MKSVLPKVLHPVGGKPMLQYVLDIAGRAGSLKTYVVLGHQNRAVRRHLEKGLVAVIQKRLQGTADAVKTVRPHFQGYSGDVLVLCGDTPLLKEKTVKGLIRRHKRSKAACTFLSAVVDHPESYGRVIRASDGRVTAIREEKDATYDEKQIREINAGVYCFKSRELFTTLSAIKLNRKKKEFYLTDVIERLLEKGLKVETRTTEDFTEGVGINDRTDLAFVEWVMRQRVLEELMLRGITVTDPQTTCIDRDVKIGNDTVVYPFTVIENNVRIGRRCRIGPFAHIRPGTVLADDVEVGNFTEVSRSRVGRGTLMKHFGFLGDARLGVKVNIGAGTVTANFDGVRKNQTRIDDKAFIGSDSILVAPVRVGRGAVTAAGSVLTKGKSVPAGGLAVGVPAKIRARRERS
jgi:bifunctional UDP-N-acetylglucosamine pyrophosphorylase/glucosamine-1-phosphate N-acetyltransferase